MQTERCQKVCTAPVNYLSSKFCHFKGNHFKVCRSARGLSTVRTQGKKVCLPLFSLCRHLSIRYWDFSDPAQLPNPLKIKTWQVIVAGEGGNCSAEGHHNRIFQHNCSQGPLTCQSFLEEVPDVQFSDCASYAALAQHPTQSGGPCNKTHLCHCPTINHTNTRCQCGPRRMQNEASDSSTPAVDQKLHATEKCALVVGNT